MSVNRQKYGLGEIRIISGIWKGRKIHFPKYLDIRPTSDKTRETLFNWLQPYIVGSSCLDLFAGSGALAFEALSRGAHKVITIDKEKKAIESLIKNSELLKADVTIIHDKIPNAKLPIQTFDVIFIDPPFYKGLIQHSIDWLSKNKHIKTGSLIYLEYENNLDNITMPKNWMIVKEKTTTETSYQLVKVD